MCLVTSKFPFFSKAEGRERGGGSMFMVGWVENLYWVQNNNGKQSNLKKDRNSKSKIVQMVNSDLRVLTGMLLHVIKAQEARSHIWFQRNVPLSYSLPNSQDKKEQEYLEK